MRISRSFTPLFAAALAALAIGCNDDDAAETDDADTYTYTARGEVEGLPQEDGGTIQIFHEEIPDFVDREGEATGMAAMSMPFGIADDLPLDDIDQGDTVEFTFEVDWDDPRVSTVTEIEKLPDDTELELD